MKLAVLDEDAYVFTVCTDENGRTVRTRVVFPGKLIASLRGAATVKVLETFAQVLDSALGEAMVGGVEDLG